MTRVVSIFGTRPEAVKMAPVVWQLARTPGIDSQVVVTAQHRQMLDQVLGLFNIRPDVDLNLMQPDQDLASLTAAIITHLDPVLADLKPDWILVQGDTTTVLASSLVGFYRHILVGHVEAGLRTSDKWQPFPEEINRRLASVVTDLHFAPTEWARRNLLRENISDKQIIVTGNPVIDALQAVVQMPATPGVLDLFNRLSIPYQASVTSNTTDTGIPRLILVTAHRRENFGQPLTRICRALAEIAARYPSDVQLIYPVHPNPNVLGPVYQMLDGIPNVTLTEPLGYRDFVRLMSQAHLILTDSGGLQEEAPSLGVPVLVLRDVTERPEGVAAGVIKVVGTDEQAILDEVSTLLEDNQAYQRMARGTNPYGDGQASRRIVEAIWAMSSDTLRSKPES